MVTPSSKLQARAFALLQVPTFHGNCVDLILAQMTLLKAVIPVLDTCPMGNTDLDLLVKQLPNLETLYQGLMETEKKLASRKKTKSKTLLSKHASRRKSNDRGRICLFLANNLHALQVPKNEPEF